MGKYRDMYNGLFTMPEEKFDELLGTSELPKFKGKIMSYDAGDTEVDPHDAFADPGFKKEFDKMSDEDKQKALAMIMNLQYDTMDGNWSEDKLLDMLDADETPDDETLIIGGTDIYKEPFTDEQLAILRKDDDYNKFSTDEFNALQAADRAKVKTARDAKLKRARELLEGNNGNIPDDPDELSEKPHDKKLATSNVLAGDLTPEEIEMIQMMRAGKKPPKSNELAGETTPEENEMLNITNRLAKNLSKHRW